MARRLGVLDLCVPNDAGMNALIRAFFPTRDDF